MRGLDSGRVLLLGKDPALFGEGNGIGDTLERHIQYAKRWREVSGESGDIKILCYTERSDQFTRQSPAKGLEIIPTRSFFRAQFSVDVWKLIKQLEYEGWIPDLISPQTPWEEGNVAAKAADKYEALLVPQLHFDLFSKQWKKESFLNPLRLALAKKVFDRANAIRVVSHALKRATVSKFFLSPEKIHVCPVPVLFEADLPENRKKNKRALHLNDCAPLVLYVGRFSIEKNLSDWIHAALKIANENSEVQFMLVGDGNERARMMQIVEQSGHGKRFHFKGTVKHHEISMYYGAADIFLLSSNHEGYGRVLVEAGLSQCAIVSTEVASSEELVEDGVTGILVKNGDILGLTNALMSLLLDSRKRKSMGCLARRKMLNEQSADLLVSRITKMWSDALSNRR